VAAWAGGALPATLRDAITRSGECVVPARSSALCVRCYWLPLPAGTCCCLSCSLTFSPWCPYWCSLSGAVVLFLRAIAGRAFGGYTGVAAIIAVCSPCLFITVVACCCRYCLPAVIAVITVAVTICYICDFRLRYGRYCGDISITLGCIRYCSFCSPFLPLRHSRLMMLHSDVPAYDAYSVVLWCDDVFCYIDIGVVWKWYSVHDGKLSGRCVMECIPSCCYTNWSTCFCSDATLVAVALLWWWRLLPLVSAGWLWSTFCWLREYLLLHSAFTFCYLTLACSLSSEHRAAVWR